MKTEMNNTVVNKLKLTKPVCAGQTVLSEEQGLAPGALWRQEERRKAQGEYH